jgi:hypothetical protein
MNPSTFFTRRNIIALVIIAFLVIAIPLGVYLARNTQIFRPQAAETTQPIKFTGTGVNCPASGDCTATTPTVEIELTSPFGAPAQ